MAELRLQLAEGSLSDNCFVSRDRSDWIIASRAITGLGTGAKLPPREGRGDRRESIVASSAARVIPIPIGFFRIPFWLRLWGVFAPIGFLIKWGSAYDPLYASYGRSQVQIALEGAFAANLMLFLAWYALMGFVLHNWTRLRVIAIRGALMLSAAMFAVPTLGTLASWIVLQDYIPADQFFLSFARGIIIALFLWLWVFFRNLRQPQLKELFAQIDGNCPTCKSQRIPKIIKKQAMTWVCSACQEVHIFEPIRRRSRWKVITALVGIIVVIPMVAMVTVLLGRWQEQNLEKVAELKTKPERDEDATPMRLSYRGKEVTGDRRFAIRSVKSDWVKDIPVRIIDLCIDPSILANEKGKRRAEDFQWFDDFVWIQSMGFVYRQLGLGRHKEGWVSGVRETTELMSEQTYLNHMQLREPVCDQLAFAEIGLPMSVRFCGIDISTIPGFAVVFSGRTTLDNEAGAEKVRVIHLCCTEEALDNKPTINVAEFEWFDGMEWIPATRFISADGDASYTSLDLSYTGLGERAHRTKLCHGVAFPEFTRPGPPPPLEAGER